jgi:CheY-like chemotaxis protein
MDGSALAEEIRSLRPETKILYMTGCSGMFIRADMLSPSVSLIRKPFTPADLGRKIRKRAVLEKKHETPPTSWVLESMCSGPNTHTIHLPNAKTGSRASRLIALLA